MECIRRKRDIRYWERKWPTLSVAWSSHRYFAIPSHKACLCLSIGPDQALFFLLWDLSQKLKRWWLGYALLHQCLDNCLEPSLAVLVQILQLLLSSICCTRVPFYSVFIASKISKAECDSERLYISNSQPCRLCDHGVVGITYASTIARVLQRTICTG